MPWRGAEEEVGDEIRPAEQGPRLALRPRGRWGEWTEHRPSAPQRRLVWLGAAFLLVLGVIMSLEGFIQRRRQAGGAAGLRVVQLSPAPESALPLMPFPGSAPDAEVEFRALLMRIPPDRQTSPTLLSVSTLSGRLGVRIEGHIGPRGEYLLSFVPQARASGRHLVLTAFRFAPAEQGSPGAPLLRPRGARQEGPEIVLEPEVPRRIDPPMEPEGGGPLVLQITGRLGARGGTDP